MDEIQCPNCGTRFERGGADFCPSAGCGFPVEFMERSTEVEEEPEREEILRRPEEDATDADAEPSEPPPEPVVSPPVDAADDEPPPPPAPVPDVEGPEDAEYTTETAPPMLDEEEGGRRFPPAVLGAGVALVAVVGLGLFLLLRGGEEELVVAETDFGAEAEADENEDVDQDGEQDGRAEVPDEDDPPPPPDDGADPGIEPEPGDGDDDRGDQGDDGDDGHNGDNGDNGGDGDDDNDGNGNGQSPDPELIEVPNVVDLEFSEAQARVAEAGLEAAVAEEETTEAPPGRVLRQDPEAGSTLEPGATVRMLVARAPEEGADLTLELVECALVLGGAPSGADALTIFVHTLNEGTAQVTRAVAVEARAGGLSNRVSARITGRDSLLPSFLELQEPDYTGPTDVTLTIDPDDEIPETRRDNNTLHVRVQLPSERPLASADPLPCG